MHLQTEKNCHKYNAVSKKYKMHEILLKQFRIQARATRRLASWLRLASVFVAESTQ